MKTARTPLPVKATLLVTMTALTLACGYSAKTIPPSAGTVPTIAALSPASATAGGPAFTLTVNGTNYAGKAVVNWNGAAQTSNTTYVSPNQLTVAVPAAAIASSGTVSITVTNPATPGTGMYGGGGTTAETSSPMSFAVN